MFLRFFAFPLHHLLLPPQMMLALYLMVTIFLFGSISTEPEPKTLLIETKDGVTKDYKDYYQDYKIGKPNDYKDYTDYKGSDYKNDYNDYRKRLGPRKPRGRSIRGNRDYYNDYNDYKKGNKWKKGRH